MGSYENIIMDYDTTQEALMHHMEISQDEGKALTSLGSVNDDLMNQWFGIGGDAFQKYASTIESEVANCIRFSDNSQEANRMLIYNNTGLDDDRADSVQGGTEGDN